MDNKENRIIQMISIFHPHVTFVFEIKESHMEEDVEVVEICKVLRIFINKPVHGGPGR